MEIKIEVLGVLPFTVQWQFNDWRCICSSTTSLLMTVRKSLYHMVLQFFSTCDTGITKIIFFIEYLEVCAGSRNNVKSTVKIILKNKAYVVLTLTIVSFLASLNWCVAVASATGTPAHIAFEHMHCQCEHYHWNLSDSLTLSSCTCFSRISSVFYRGDWGSCLNWVLQSFYWRQSSVN